jgi:hypothetical protein
MSLLANYCQLSIINYPLQIGIMQFSDKIV